MFDIELILSNIDKEEPTNMEERFSRLLKQNEYNGYLSACTDISKIVIADFKENNNANI